MVTLSSEDQDGLPGFCLQLARCNGVVSADCIQCVGTLYNCMNAFKQLIFSSTTKQCTVSSAFRYVYTIVCH